MFTTSGSSRWSSIDWSSAFGPARLVQWFWSSGLYYFTLYSTCLIIYNAHTHTCKLTIISAYFINMNELNKNVPDDVIEDVY